MEFKIAEKSQIDNKILLVKIPNSIRSEIEKNPNAVIGSIQYNKNLSEFSLILESQEKQEKTKYEIKMEQDIVRDGYIVAENTKTKEFSFVGSVRNKGSLSVGNLKKFQQIQRQKNKIQEPRRAISEFDPETEKPVMPQKKSQDKTKKQNRRFRMKEEDLRQELFDCFKQKEFWALDEINSKVNQPEDFLKKVLGEIAYYHKKGDFKHNWELKPEFKHI
ncbi:general transcription factor iif subunit 2 [Anaeramoeba ignava]|uniref:General transcription factor iif subunit 2 n=1 Tax=Anaeramoeba ignava TaxID=1746090 RepID=A0A9Q0LH54_ANAIG|nr:general transcription factor iif subunit 2 [Anaeramoeba ignava]